MQTVNFPKDYQQVMPYLIIQNATGFIDFMKDVFDATEKVKHMRDENIIMHGEVLVGESVIMFAGCYSCICTTHLRNVCVCS